MLDGGPWAAQKRAQVVSAQTAVTPVIGFSFENCDDDLVCFNDFVFAHCVFS